MTAQTTQTTQDGVRRTNTMAILALVFAFLFAPLAIVFGVVARNQIARTGENGRGLATTGLVLGVVLTLVSLVGVVGMIALVAYGAGT